MENYQATLGGIDLELRRVNDTQLDTIRRNYPHNITVNAEWRSRQTRPPPVARKIEMEANKTMATEASNSNSRIRAMASQSGVSKSEIRDNIADIRREILEEISREEEPGEFWPLQRPPLGEELLNVDESADNGTDSRHYEITRGNNATKYRHSCVQELAMQNIIFNSLPVVNPEDNHVGRSHTACLSNKESDADEEDDIEEISRSLVDLHFQESNQKREDGRSQETDEGADGDDEDSSFEPSEPEYVFVNPRRTTWRSRVLEPIKILEPLY